MPVFSSIFTNYDSQRVVNSDEELKQFLLGMSHVKEGSGELTIHAWALKNILTELLYCRQLLKEKEA